MNLNEIEEFVRMHPEAMRLAKMFLMAMLIVTGMIFTNEIGKKDTIDIINYANYICQGRYVWGIDGSGIHYFANESNNLSVLKYATTTTTISNGNR